MENIPRDYEQLTDEELFELFRQQSDQKGYYSGEYKFKFYRMNFLKTKDNTVTLRCTKIGNKCRAVVELTRRGCEEWLFGLEHTYWNASERFDHNHEPGEEKARKIPNKSKYVEPTDEEIDDLILNKNCGLGFMMRLFGNRVPNVGRENLKRRVRLRIEKWKGKATVNNCIEDCETICLNERVRQFCQADCKINVSGRQSRFIIFTSKEQLLLLEKGEVIAVDGFFKLKIQNFKQLLTFAIFLKSIYVPIVHILMQDKTKEAYIMAFMQLNTLIMFNLKRTIDWKEKTFITDYENGLCNAIAKVFNPGTQNNCYFHFIKAIKENFNERVPPHLHENKKEFFDFLKMTPFLKKSVENLLFEDKYEFPITEKGIITAIFFWYFGDKQEILPFLRYFMRRWYYEQFNYQDDDEAVQRTTNEAETIHEMFRQMGMQGVTRIAELTATLIEIDEKLFKAYVDMEINDEIANKYAWRSTPAWKINKETYEKVENIYYSVKSQFKCSPDNLFPNGLFDLEESIINLHRPRVIPQPEQPQPDEELSDGVIDYYDDQQMFSDIEELEGLAQEDNEEE